MKTPKEYSLTETVRRQIRDSRDDEAMALFCEWAPREGDERLSRLNRALTNLHARPAA